jgi:VanZ family protein
MNSRVLRIVPLIFWCSLIFYLSSQTAVSVSAEQSVDTFAHKLAHVIEYAILFGLFVFGLSKTFKLNTVLIMGIIFVALYGISDEIHQSFVPTRGPRATDVLFDTLGGLIGYIFIKLYLKIRKIRT